MILTDGFEAHYVDSKVKYLFEFICNQWIISDVSKIIDIWKNSISIDKYNLMSFGSEGIKKELWYVRIYLFLEILLSEIKKNLIQIWKKIKHRSKRGNYDLWNKNDLQQKLHSSYFELGKEVAELLEQIHMYVNYFEEYDNEEWIEQRDGVSKNESFVYYSDFESNVSSLLKEILQCYVDAVNWKLSSVELSKGTWKHKIWAVLSTRVVSQQELDYEKTRINKLSQANKTWVTLELQDKNVIENLKNIFLEISTNTPTEKILDAITCFNKTPQIFNQETSLKHILQCLQKAWYNKYWWTLDPQSPLFWKQIIERFMIFIDKQSYSWKNAIEVLIKKRKEKQK